MVISAVRGAPDPAQSGVKQCGRERGDADQQRSGRKTPKRGMSASMAVGVKVRWLCVVFAWLAACGGVVVVDEGSGQGEGDAGAGAGSAGAGAGNAGGTGGGSSQDAGADDAEAGPPQWCDIN